MNCPNCGGKISNTNQKYCEVCGSELLIINNPSNKEVKVKPSSTHSKRRCC